MASSDSVRIAIGEEDVAYGTPATATTTLRFTSESLATQPTTQSSDELAADGIPVDAVRTGITGGGDINGLLSITNWDELFQGVQYSDVGFGSAGLYNTVSAPAGGATFNRVGGWAGLTAGQWIKMTGFSGAGAANNKVWKVTDVSGTLITVVGGTVIEDASTAGSAEQAQVIISGGALPTLTSYTIERWNSDESSGEPFTRYTGAVPNSFNISMRDQGPITVRFGFVSEPETTEASELVAPTAAPTGAVMGGLDVQAILEGDGTNYNLDLGCIKSFDLTLTNGARLQECSNEIDPVAVARGSFNVEGTFSFLFEGTVTQIDRWLNGTTSGVAFIVTDGTNGYVFECPEIRPGEVTRSTPGSGQDVDVSLGFTAFKESSTGAYFNISRFDGIAN